MSSNTSPTYPRPDFVRSPLRWRSLNGSWDFLFDDEDIGQLARWHQKGLPEEVSLTTSKWVASDKSAETISITQQIAALPEKLLKDNVFTNSSKETNRKCQINVPFVFQTEASGIDDQTAHEVLWYERLIPELRESTDVDHGHRLLLRFGAIDYEASVWIDGQFVGFHRGGHVPFEVDISDVVHKENARLTIRVRDSPFDCGQPRGKQYWGPKPESIFYTPSSGIWQSVWLEVVPSTRIADSSHGTILRSDDIAGGQMAAHIAVTGLRARGELKIEVEACIASCVVSKVCKDLTRETAHVAFNLDMRLSQEQICKLPSSIAHTDSSECWRNGVALWSPESPLLYDIVIRLFDDGGTILDEVHTTTGMRSLNWTTGDRTFRLNDRPYFQALVLDQGYWRSSGLTPPNSESLKSDIEISKQMGFNGCRKHQKVEDPIFLYWADRLGYLVWGEMANGYWFNNDYVQRFDQEWMEAVRRDINHPSIVAWTPVNESWGYPSLKDNVEQRNHIRSTYYTTKYDSANGIRFILISRRTLDPTRPINDNCGWEHVKTDLTTFHEYADAPILTDVCSTLEGILGLKAGREMFVKPIDKDVGAEEQPGAPVICTEFGGVNIAPDKDTAAGEREWGYTTASDPNDLSKRLDALVMAIVNGGRCCGFVYTQLTDIEQEVNGLYTFDRTPKLDVTKVKAIMDKAKTTYFDLLGLAGEN